MKTLMAVIAVVFALMFTTSVHAQSVENTPESCGDDVSVDCEMLMFISLEDDGSMGVIMTQRVSDPLMSQLILEDQMIDAFIEGFGSENARELLEVTPAFESDPDFLSEGDFDFRAFVGTTEMTGESEDILFFFVSGDTESFIFVSAGSIETIPEYIEEVLTGDDWTVTPEGFFFAGSLNN